ncbi:MAG: hypothetical protein JO006_00070 [Paucibacter sp.]|nr:hypothetical protein [Roseateles sp.]
MSWHLCFDVSSTMTSATRAVDGYPEGGPEVEIFLNDLALELRRAGLTAAPKCGASFMKRQFRVMLIC